MKCFVLYGTSLLVVLIVGALGISAVALARISRQPNTQVEFLPPREWFTHGIAACGPASSTITKIYGPVAITRTYYYTRKR